MNTQAVDEWLFLRLQTMLDFESNENVQGLDEYFIELERLNNKRTVDNLEKTEKLDIDIRE